VDIAGLQDAIRQDQLFASGHAAREALADGINVDAVWASLAQTAIEVIEDYPNEPRGPCCLLLCFVQGRPIHTVISYPSKRYAAQRQVNSLAFMVTIYRPDLRPHEWTPDYRVRLPSP
jgi:hypothetical protein